jgi:hypothetical protein
MLTFTTPEISGIRGAVHESMPISCNVRTQIEQAYESLAMERLFAKFRTLFGWLRNSSPHRALWRDGLFLSQGLRRLELRMALGANRGNVLRMVVR